MNQALRVITPAVCEPVTLDEVKLHARIDANGEDALLRVLIAAARAHGEQITGRAFVSQTRELTLDGFPGADAAVEIPAPPLGEIISVSYDDPEGTTQPLADTQYRIATVSDSVPALLRPARGSVWPSTDVGQQTVRIRFTCGWPVTGTGAEGDPYVVALPEALKAWLLMRVTGLYEQREPFLLGGGQQNRVVEMPRSFADALLDPFVILEVV